VTTRSKDTKIAAGVKLPRCLGGGDESGVRNKSGQGQFEETEAPSTRELSITPDGSGCVA